MTVLNEPTPLTFKKKLKALLKIELLKDVSFSSAINGQSMPRAAAIDSSNGHSFSEKLDLWLGEKTHVIGRCKSLGVERVKPSTLMVSSQTNLLFIVFSCKKLILTKLLKT